MAVDSPRVQGSGLSPRVMWIGIAVLLLVPAIAMRFTQEVAWTARDFVLAALLLGTSGLVYQFAVRRLRYRTWRNFASVVLLVALLAIWAEGAVGIL